MFDGIPDHLNVDFMPLCLADVRFLLATVDQTQRIVSHVGLKGSGERACDVLGSVDRFAEVFPDEPFCSAVAGKVETVLGGTPMSLDIVPSEGGRLRLTFLPRIQGKARQRGFFLVVEDVTAIEAGRRESETLRQRMSEILKRAADVILVTDEDGRIEEANEAVSRLLGWRPEALVGERLEVLMDEPYRSAHRGYIDRYLETGTSGILNVGPRPLPARHRDGSVVAIELSVAAAWIAGERKFIGVCRGIEERLRQQRELEEGNRILRGKIAELEQARADLETRKRQSHELAQAAESARREAEEASRMKSRFLATVSHELRTPLNGVLAVADVLAEQPLPDEAREMATIIRRSGHDLLKLLNEILDLSRVEAGATAIRAEPFSVSGLVQSTASVWSAAAAAKGLELRVEADGVFGDATDGVTGDAGRIRQVLSNLLNNAIKFTAEGSVTLEACREPAESGFTALRFVVSDTGPGMDLRVRERLFEPFVTGTAEGTGHQTGAGLGLAISRELVGLMGGSIRAEAAPGGGAAIVVELELPAVEAPEGAAGSPVDAPQAAPVTTIAPATASSDSSGWKGADDPCRAGAMRILVAEDHPVNRQVISLLLDQIGAVYRIVEDGEAAVAAEAAGVFDVILMDVRMPRMDGMEATRAIRAAGSAVPIIAVTADATADQESRMFQAGMDAVLPKPITLTGLAQILEDLLAARAAA